MIEIAEEIENRFFVSCYWPFPFHVSIDLLSPSPSSAPRSRSSLVAPRSWPRSAAMADLIVSLHHDKINFDFELQSILFRKMRFRFALAATRSRRFRAAGGTRRAGPDPPTSPLGREFRGRPAISRRRRAASEPGPTLRPGPGGGRGTSAPRSDRTAELRDRPGAPTPRPRDPTAVSSTTNRLRGPGACRRMFARTARVLPGTCASEGRARVRVASRGHGHIRPHRACPRGALHGRRDATTSRGHGRVRLHRARRARPPEDVRVRRTYAHASRRTWLRTSSLHTSSGRITRSPERTCPRTGTSRGCVRPEDASVQRTCATVAHVIVAHILGTIQCSFRGRMR